MLIVVLQRQQGESTAAADTESASAVSADCKSLLEDEPEFTSTPIIDRPTKPLIKSTSAATGMLLSTTLYSAGRKFHWN